MPQYLTLPARDTELTKEAAQLWVDSFVVSTAATELARAILVRTLRIAGFDLPITKIAHTSDGKAVMVWFKDEVLRIAL